METDTLTPAELHAMEEARPSALRWSEVNGEFLDFVAQNPEYLERDTFSWLHSQHWLRKLNLQSWPLFMDERRRREVERMTLGIDRMMKGVVERFLQNDPARILEFYRSPVREKKDFELTERNLRIMLSEPDGIATAPSRADYLEGPEGFRCLEYNAGGALGGVQTGVIGGMHLASEPLARFLGATGRRARAADTLEAYFRHLIDESARLGVWKGGEFNVGVAHRPHTEEQVSLHSAEMYDGALQRVLAERGMTGGAYGCATTDFAEERQVLVAGGRQIHVVLQLHDRNGHLRLPFALSKMGCVTFISGPIGFLLSDKRNLALVSEHARSDEFTAEERALIEQYIPWTRQVAAAPTTFRGRGVRLPDDLVDHREALVLKKAESRNGNHVVVGRFRTDAEWREDVARAVREGSWIVQEYVEPVAYCFQRGERGAVLHDLVWGLFAFGEHFGGAFLRMQPRGGTGVVNSAHGAAEGVCLFVEE